MPLIRDFSLQLYSLRSEAGRGLGALLGETAKAGFTGVEFAGYGGLEAAELKELLVGYGLKPVGTHVGIERLNDALDEELAFNKEIGTEYIVVPYYPMETEADARAAARGLRSLAPKIRAAGFGFAYHNHYHEFGKADSGGGEFGKADSGGSGYLLDVMCDIIPANEMDIELDIYWAAYAGIDYLDWIKRRSGRVKLVHVKQMRDYESKKCVDLDEGVIDYHEIIKVGLGLNVKHFILEQEEFAGSPFTGIKKGCDYIYSL